MTEIDPSAPVLVTGGSGYVASWIVSRFLDDGHTVRATVRDPDKASGLEHLHELADLHEGRLTLHRADLLDEGSFDEAMADCQLIVHTASPFLMDSIKDPHEQLIRPALEGTRNVLGAVERTESVRRVVLTSSIAAIFGDNADMEGQDCFTDRDWNDTSSETHQEYPYSKTVAEREAWALHDAQDRWDLVTVNPGLVLGPSLTSSSASGSMTTMRRFTDGSMILGAPALEIGAVDVRDVAETHYRAAMTPAAHGRYIANAETLSLLDLGRALSEHFGSRPSFPSRELPKLFIKIGAPIAKMTQKYVDRNIGWPLRFDSSRAVDELGVTFRPVRESVVEHFEQMIEEGTARPSRR